MKKALVNVACLLVCAFFVFPVYWMATTALKPDSDILRHTPKLVPSPVHWDNFREILTASGFWNAMRSSLLVTGAVVLLGMAVSFLAAVALARFRFRGRTAFLLAIIIVQMIPGEALFIPFYLMLRDARLLGTYAGLVIVYMSFTLPFAVWMLRGFVTAVPAELEQAAMVDGASRFQAFRKVVFPLVAPGLMATSVFSWITAWTEFTYAYVLLDEPARYTLPVYIQSFIGRYATDYGPQMAVATLFTLPVVVFFLIIQRRAVAGLSAGAVKG
ncbi:N,N'-diacetylchitobiose transport system permease protein [Thermocatellispora tengchongensis]|uniref:N,N'-diacetylchitobiose transport system permease protein n=1 Tax=Thermocatellispora tengchongensis TaxID=1073253 RepID=A0A840PD95_9ACTN|nr:carbohydrate ABC transporter permease [Thermocatellispora tengchongensis]MBB5135137.1 N,N'-diacetylchitobiose transport system permease protein [Thermocatellispora tengchongensis]